MNLSKYDYFINPSCIKMILGEIFLLIFLSAGTLFLFPSVFESNALQVYYFDFNISLYYLYPVVLGFFCIIAIIIKIFKTYRYTVFSFSFKENLIKLNICWFLTVTVKDFEVVVGEPYRIQYRNGFKKEFFDCVGIKSSKSIYLIPVVAAKKNELIKILSDHIEENFIKIN
ncbi:hypothetical protein [uncultured Acinetobacter sp.]|uniref:hypothetical protein n=1 Tax=uncultured Acinetobacter sp. TaxID=165433 RepID=UPI0025856C69|nr:hypothetical protein [uncultured Acinetobacter sp.]